MITTILAFILVFGILVFVHELGHFIAARAFGVRVEEFAFGFPPKIWSKKKDDTLYAINAIPIGGYVKLYGEAGEGKKNAESLAHKGPWQKVAIMVAGVVMNLILAWLLLTLFYIIGGKPILPGMSGYSGVQDERKVVVTGVVKGSPADLAKISNQSEIISVNDVRINEASTISQVIARTQEVNGVKDLKVGFIDQGQQKEAQIKTYKEKVQSGGQTVEVDRIGIEMTEEGVIRATWYKAPLIGLMQLGNIVKLNAVGLYDFFKGLIIGKGLSEDVGGPIAIAQMSGGAARLGFAVLIQFLAVLSIAVAILNILPFPALDGGHILFIAIESIIGRPVPDRVKNAINLTGFGLLLLLMVIVTFGDLSRLGIIEKLMRIF